MTEIPDGILKALHAVQANAPTLPKDKKAQVGSREYKYTALETIVEQTKDLLRTNQLVWYTMPGGTHEAPQLYYTLQHFPSGQSIDGTMPLMIGENPTSQALGSAITYARRYALTAVLNLVADEDDDGAASQSYGRAAQKPAQGSGLTSGRPMASEAQVKLIKRLITEKQVTPEQMRVIFERLGIHVAGAGWMGKLTGGKEGQASALITFLKENPVPTGASDVPADTSSFDEQLKHDVEGGAENLPVPFDEETKP